MMKTAFAALALVTISMSAQAGVVINEGFDHVADLASQGWVFLNAGTPGGTTPGWFQGDSGVFGAQAGSAGAYAAANFNNAPAGGVILSWLATPVFDASHGADVAFYLRAAGDGYADKVAYGFTAGGALTSVDPVPDGGWTRYTVHLDANTLGTTRFAFAYYGDADAANYVGLDTLSVSTPSAGDVPEPASLALFSGGLLGLSAIRRRACT